MNDRADRLAVLRVLVGTFAVVYLLVRSPVFLALRSEDPDAFEPVGALWWMESPPPDALVVGAFVLAIVAGVAFTVGELFRITGPVFAAVVLFLTTLRSSWGQLLWFENLMVLHLLLVGFAPAADALSVDARRREPRPRSGDAYTWPVRTAAIVTVLTYVLAGVAKLRIGGFEWLDGDTMRNHVAYSATRLDVLGGTSSPLARPFVESGWLAAPAAVGTVAFELGAPVALLGGRIRTAWVAGAWLFHAGVAAAMFVVFPYPLFLVAFAPLFPLERVAATVRRRVSALRRG